MLKPQDKTRNHRLQYFSNTLQKKKAKYTEEQLPFVRVSKDAVTNEWNERAEMLIEFSFGTWKANFVECMCHNNGQVGSHTQKVIIIV